MKNFTIITDSNCDISQKMVDEIDVQVIPMEYRLGDNVYYNYPDEKEQKISEFYTNLRDGILPSTAQINMMTYIEKARPILKEGRDVLFLIFSSRLSGSFNSCQLAVNELKEEFPERKIIAEDTLAASMGEGLLLYYAASQRKAGKTIEETAEWVLNNRLSVAHWFTVDDLNFLHRGGRVSGASAVVGSMLSIKPVLHVDEEGCLKPVSKIRGRIKSLDTLVTKLAETIDTKLGDVVFISHGDCEDDAKYVYEAIKEKHGIKRIEINNIGPVIGAHSGPGTVALFWMGNKECR